MNTCNKNPTCSHIKRFFNFLFIHIRYTDHCRSIMKFTSPDHFQDIFVINQPMFHIHNQKIKSRVRKHLCQFHTGKLHKRSNKWFFTVNKTSHCFFHLTLHSAASSGGINNSVSDNMTLHRLLSYRQMHMAILCPHTKFSHCHTLIKCHKTSGSENAAQFLCIRQFRISALTNTVRSVHFNN